MTYGQTRLLYRPYNFRNAAFKRDSWSPCNNNLFVRSLPQLINCSFAEHCGFYINFHALVTLLHRSAVNASVNTFLLNPSQFEQTSIYDVMNKIIKIHKRREMQLSYHIILSVINWVNDWLVFNAISAQYFRSSIWLKCSFSWIQ